MKGDFISVKFRFIIVELEQACQLIALQICYDVSLDGTNIDYKEQEEGEWTQRYQRLKVKSPPEVITMLRFFFQQSKHESVCYLTTLLQLRKLHN
jgi:hypothetical protein